MNFNFKLANIKLSLKFVKRKLLATCGYSAIWRPNFVIWVRAGHDPAILCDPRQNTFEELAGTGIALGVNENFRYEQYKKTGIADGQIVAIGTDGIWEACNPSGEMFGKKRFQNVIRQRSRQNASDILGAVYEELDHFTKGLKSEDDITLVVAKVQN